MSQMKRLRLSSSTVPGFAYWYVRSVNMWNVLRLVAASDPESGFLSVGKLLHVMVEDSGRTFPVLRFCACQILNMTVFYFSCALHPKLQVPSRYILDMKVSCQAGSLL